MQFAAVTSNVPFAAIVVGKNQRSALREHPNSAHLLALLRALRPATQSLRCRARLSVPVVR